jgi:hypothetical protein
MRNGTMVPQQAFVVKKSDVDRASRRNPGPFRTSSKRLASGFARASEKGLRFFIGRVSAIVKGMIAQTVVQHAAA